MSQITGCSDLSLAAHEPLAGTATQGSDWLLVEVRGAWGGDAIRESGLPAALRDDLSAYPGKVILIRRPDRRVGGTVIRAVVREDGGDVLRWDLDALRHPSVTDLSGGDVVHDPVLLVCTHGRRDACCARLGAPLYEALAPHVAPEQLWQASHLGGHRFAPNVLVLPYGIQFGRIPLDRAREVVDAVMDGRIPLDLYRGRTLYTPWVQAAEVAVRRASGCDEVDGLTLVSDDGERVTFATPAGVISARVEQQEGKAAPLSCGAEYEPTTGWIAALER